jgi:single-strand DNA-binding protein
VRPCQGLPDTEKPGPTGLGEGMNTMRHDGAELTLSGRAATNPSISGGNSERVTFRAVSTERRYDETAGEWVDGDEFGIAVVCWRQLGTSVLGLLRKGDPVVVTGKLSTRRYEKDGVTDYFTECKADHVAIDVARAAGRIRRQELTNGAAPAQDTAAATPETGQPAVADAGAGDPFQQGSEEAHRELAEVG